MPACRERIVKAPNMMLPLILYWCRNSAWFRNEPWGENWIRLYRKELTPPFKPKVKSEQDVSRVDETFLNEAVCTCLKRRRQVVVQFC